MEAGQPSPSFSAGSVLPAAISVSISAHGSGGTQGEASTDTAGVAMVPVAAAVGSVLGAIQSVTNATPRATAVGEPSAPPHGQGEGSGTSALGAGATDDLLLQSTAGSL